MLHLVPIPVAVSFKILDSQQPRRYGVQDSKEEVINIQ